MGLDITIVNRSEVNDESIANIRVQYRELSGTDIQEVFELLLLVNIALFLLEQTSPKKERILVLFRSNAIKKEVVTLLMMKACKP
jgi:hypothetical protein